MQRNSAQEATVEMVCREPVYSEAVLPEGYSFAFYRRGVENAWCEIQCSVRAFDTPEAARSCFQETFSAREAQLSRRLLFVCDRMDRPIATAALMPEDGSEWLMWLAVIPGLTRRGIGKALVRRALQIHRDENCASEIRLRAPADACTVINICRKLGFVPDRGKISEEKFRELWQGIDERIASYERRVGAPGDADEDHSEHYSFLFQSNGAQKSAMCKIFMLSSPAQSGDIPHDHDYLQIWYVMSGQVCHEVEGMRYTLHAGDAFFIPPKVTHRTVLGENGKVICCEFDIERILTHSMAGFERAKEAAQNTAFMMLFQKDLFNIQPKLTFSSEGQRQVEQLMLSMLREYNAAELYFEDILQLEILQLLLLFSREYERFPIHEESEKVFTKYRNLVGNAIQYIDEHYDEALTLEGMCRISMVSKTYFCYIFKMLTNKTFVEYLMERRIEKSMALLRDSDLSIIDIGHAVGFNEPTHFSRTFRKMRGISPREYRSGSRQGASDSTPG